MLYTHRFWESWGRKDYWIAEWLKELARPGHRPIGHAWAYVCVIVYERDEKKCSKCGVMGGYDGKKDTDIILHVHHIIPLSKGGNSLPENLTLLCEKCHKGKHRKKDAGVKFKINPDQKTLI